MCCKGRESKGVFKDEDVKLMADKLVTSINFFITITVKILINFIRTIIINILCARWNKKSR